jgi:hypothetical protein
LEVSQGITKEISHWDTKKKGEANNQISCSLITNNHISHTKAEIGQPDVILGFNQIENGDLLFAIGNDGGIMVDKKLVATKMDEYNTHPPKDILKTGGYGNMYNEVLITRYKQDGQPRKPDFIITFNGETNDRIEQAINYFEIPIINFETSEYIKKINQQIQTTLEKINQHDSLDEKKDLFKEIPYLDTNKEKWRTTVKEWVYDKNLEAQLKQQLFQTEESIIGLQLIHDREMATLVTENFKAQMSPESLEKLLQTTLSLTKKAYSSDSTDFIYNAPPELKFKWFQDSHQTLRETLTLATPDIIKFYQNQITRLSNSGGDMDINQFNLESEKFRKYAMVSVVNNQPLLRDSVRRDDRGIPISEDPIKYGQKYKEIDDLLNQIYSVQENLKTTISSGLKQAEAREKQKQIDNQNTTLETVSSNTEGLISLLKENSYDHQFREKIIKKIKEHLIDDKRDKTELIKDLRANYESLQNLSINNAYWDSVYKLADGDQYKIETYKLLTDPNQISEVPQKIEISDEIKTESLGYDQKSRIISFVSPNNEKLLFKIHGNNESSQTIEHPNDDSIKNQMNNINKKWFWRLRRQIPKLNDTNTYQLNNHDVNSPLLVENKNRWYLIDKTSVKKINMANFNI